MEADQGKPPAKADVILAGGGLASCLIALWLVAYRRGVRVVMLEAGDRICGNHTWSFHQPDVLPEDYRLLEPVVGHVWPGQKVVFPRYERELSTGYVSMTSDALREAVYGAEGITIREGTPVAQLEPEKAVLETGETISAPCVIDARGFSPHAALKLGYQKFIGQEWELTEPHGERVPTIMDARVPQLDGYRFVYVLPLSPTRLLIEDTRYSDAGTVDDDTFRDGIAAYAAQKGWTAREIVREESGVLPITLAEDGERFWAERMSGPALVGLRAGFFQPATGYSLPEAVRVANIIAKGCDPLTSETALSAVYAHARKRKRDQAFYRLLNRMLFQAAKPEERYLVLQRFYSLSQGLIERFYACELTMADKLRILTGRPPVPFFKALSCVSEARTLAEHSSEKC